VQDNNPYEKKVINALSIAETMQDIEYIQEKIQTTRGINRRSKEGKAFQERLMVLAWDRWVELFGDVPF